MYPPQHVFLTWGLQSLGQPRIVLGELTAFVDCLKLFAELCMNVYTGIFLRKEVPAFIRFSKGLGT